MSPNFFSGCYDIAKLHVEGSVVYGLRYEHDIPEYFFADASKPLFLRFLTKGELENYLSANHIEMQGLTDFKTQWEDFWKKTDSNVRLGE